MNVLQLVYIISETMYFVCQHFECFGNLFVAMIKMTSYEGLSNGFLDKKCWASYDKIKILVRHVIFWLKRSQILTCTTFFLLFRKILICIIIYNTIVSVFLELVTNFSLAGTQAFIFCQQHNLKVHLSIALFVIILLFIFLMTTNLN